MAEQFAKFGGVFPIERASGSGNFESVSLDDFAQADYAVEQALRYGKFRALLDRLRNAKAQLLPIEREIAADLIEGKLKRPRKRIKDPETTMRAFRYAFEVMRLKHLCNKAAISVVAEKNAIGVSTVTKAFKKHRGSKILRSLFPNGK